MLPHCRTNKMRNERLHTITRTRRYSIAQFAPTLGTRPIYGNGRANDRKIIQIITRACTAQKPLSRFHLKL